MAWKNVPLTGTVPEMLAVTEPICAVLPTNAGRVVRDTGCVAGKFETEIAENVTACEAGKFPIVTEEILMGTVPEIDAVTEPICAVPAPIVTVPLIVTALARS